MRQRARVERVARPPTRQEGKAGVYAVIRGPKPGLGRLPQRGRDRGANVPEVRAGGRVLEGGGQPGDRQGPLRRHPGPRRPVCLQGTESPERRDDAAVLPRCLSGDARGRGAGDGPGAIGGTLPDGEVGDIVASLGTLIGALPASFAAAPTLPAAPVRRRP